MSHEATIARLREQVFQCFPVVPVPNVRLEAARTMDNWGQPPPEWPAEAWTNWSDIPFELLNRAECLLTYFEGAVLVYFLPAFLVRFLAEAETSSQGFSSPVDSLFMHLSWWRQRGFRDLPFTREQLELVAEIFAFGHQFDELRRTIEAA